MRFFLVFNFNILLIFGVLFSSFTVKSQTKIDSLTNNTFLQEKLSHEVKKLEYKSELEAKKLKSNKDLIINSIIIGFTLLLSLFFCYNYKRKKSVSKKLEFSYNVKPALITKNDLSKDLKIIEKLVLLKSRAKNINFTILNEAKDKVLYFDKIKLQQILLNLISNAIKYTNNEGNVTLVVKVISESKRYINLIFIIKETGIEKDKKDISQIKEEFYQINKNEKRNDELGLSIVSNLLYKMNSKLEVYSVLKQGSSFSFNLKLKKVKPIKEKLKIVLNKEEVKHVLIVDDNKMNIQSIKQLFSNFYKSVNIIEAFDGKECLMSYIKHRPSLIIMDLHMPIMDGYEATGHIRKLNKNVPILVCSSNILNKNTAYIKSLGFTDFLEKPIDINKFKEKINKILY